MALEWKDGGSEPLVWASAGRRGRKTFCAVWPVPQGFVAWVMEPDPPSKFSRHPTEGEAKSWCEALMPDEAGKGTTDG